MQRHNYAYKARTHHLCLVTESSWHPLYPKHYGVDVVIYMPRAPPFPVSGPFLFPAFPYAHSGRQSSLLMGLLAIIVTVVFQLCIGSPQDIYLWDSVHPGLRSQEGQGVFETVSKKCMLVFSALFEAVAPSWGVHGSCFFWLFVMIEKELTAFQNFLLSKRFSSRTCIHSFRISTVEEGVRVRGMNQVFCQFKVCLNLCCII